MEMKGAILKHAVPNRIRFGGVCSRETFVLVEMIQRQVSGLIHLHLKFEYLSMWVLVID